MGGPPWDGKAGHKTRWAVMVATGSDRGQQPAPPVDLRVTLSWAQAYHSSKGKRTPSFGHVSTVEGNTGPACWREACPTSL